MDDEYAEYVENEIAEEYAKCLLDGDHRALTLFEDNLSTRDMIREPVHEAGFSSSS